MSLVSERFGAPSNADLKSLAQRLRPADVCELYETMGVSPLSGLRASVAASDEVWSYYVDDALIAVAGVNGAPLFRVGTPWFLGSPEVRKYRKQLMRASLVLIDRWMTRFNRLENVVSARHDESIKYLQWAGFTIGPSRVNRFGYAVHPFYMET